MRFTKIDFLKDRVALGVCFAVDRNCFLNKNVTGRLFATLPLKDNDEINPAPIGFFGYFLGLVGEKQSVGSFFDKFIQKNAYEISVSVEPNKEGTLSVITHKHKSLPAPSQLNQLLDKVGGHKDGLESLKKACFSFRPNEDGTLDVVLHRNAESPGKFGELIGEIPMDAVGQNKDAWEFLKESSFVVEPKPNGSLSVMFHNNPLVEGFFKSFKSAKWWFQNDKAAEECLNVLKFLDGLGFRVESGGGRNISLGFGQSDGVGRQIVYAKDDLAAAVADMVLYKFRIVDSNIEWEITLGYVADGCDAFNIIVSGFF